MSRKSLSKRSVYGITKFTTLDYSDHLACIIWFAKCNMRCSYCYNPKIVYGEGVLSDEEVFDFLKSRTRKLDGVVLSGGECTLNPDIVEFCEEVKELGFKIKIDTNGLKPDILKELIELSLVDFIALDYKAPSKKFTQITKSLEIEKFYQTLDMLIEKKFSFEVRTTCHQALIDEDDINYIISDLVKRDYRGTYFIQNYLHVEETIGKLPLPLRVLDKNLVATSIPIVYRNFS